ncbi:MFS transporter [Pseudactinotalea sp.]|uniref:MFS transporter n=1 Tax=Pseudactinotalea sp. TaxID=1926260 RepID=UPI003B3A227B
MSRAVGRRPLGPSYRKLFASAVSANLGDGLMAIAVVWLASALTRDAMVIAIIGLLSRLPWLVFTLPAGVIADRVDRRRLVAWMDVIRFALIAMFGLVVLRFQDGVPTPEELAAGAAPPASAPVLLIALGALSLLLGFAEVLRDNTAQTLMPAVVDKSQLERANGRLWGAETAMNNFVGPPLGGVLIAIALAVPFLINAGLLAVSAALVFAMVGSFRPAGEPRTGKIAWRAEIGEGFRWLWRHRLLRPLALLLGGMNMLSSMAFVVLVLFVQDVLGLYEGWQFGLVTTGVATGAVIGSLVSDKVAERLTPGTSLFVAIVGSGVATAAMALTTSAVLFWVAGVLSGVLIVLWNVITVSLRQRLIPDQLLGRVNSVYRFFGWGTISIGTALGGVMVTAAEPLLGREWALRAPLLVAAVLTLSLLIYAVGRVGTPQIRAAESEAEAAGADSSQPTDQVPPVDEGTSAVVGEE